MFNGSSWDEHYLKTSSDQVAHTKADGTATTVQDELLAQNSALAGKANSSHTHDDRYYTESEMNAKLNALDTKIVTQLHNLTTTSNWATISKTNHTLLDAYMVRDDSSYYIKGISRRNDGAYTLIFDGITTATQVSVYAVWCKNDAV